MPPESFSLRSRTLAVVLATIATITIGCGSLEKKSALINTGDSKERVLSVMGPRGDGGSLGEGQCIKRFACSA